MKRGRLVLVTGGARSGKSGFAETMCMEQGQEIGYIATAQALDEGMVERIRRHQARRPDSWTTYEEPVEVDRLLREISVSHDVLLLDCLTVLTTNIMLSDETLDWDTVPRSKINEIENCVTDRMKAIIAAAKEEGQVLVAVTNEVGLGIVPENRLARIFRDIAGKSNEIFAGAADEVYFVVSGIPMKIKG